MSLEQLAMTIFTTWSALGRVEQGLLLYSLSHRVKRKHMAPALPPSDSALTIVVLLELALAPYQPVEGNTCSGR